MRGEVEHIALAPSTTGLTSLSTAIRVDGDTVCVGFSPDAGVLDPTDRSAVAAVLAVLMPGVEVVDVFAHDWTADEFSRGTWCVLKPGLRREFLRALQGPEGRVVLAGADIADGWSGTIDGAIESGLRAARIVKPLAG